MAVVSCATPLASALGADAVGVADFRCAHRTPLTRLGISVTDAFHAIFAHRPAWMNATLMARNRVAGAFGLETSTDEEIRTVRRQASYIVGEKIGGWPIYALKGNELIAGRDNAHMDFRVSILKTECANGVDLFVSTVCWTRNLFGRGYLATVIPFHRIGVKALITRAVAAGRL